MRAVVIHGPSNASAEEVPEPVAALDTWWLMSLELGYAVRYRQLAKASTNSGSADGYPGIRYLGVATAIPVWIGVDMSVRIALRSVLWLVGTLRLLRSY
jgi:hypothetical protein